jgi:xylose isomerase
VNAPARFFDTSAPIAYGGVERSLAELADRALASSLDPQPRSGRQENLESLVNRYV